MQTLRIHPDSGGEDNGRGPTHIKGRAGTVRHVDCWSYSRVVPTRWEGRAVRQPWGPTATRLFLGVGRGPRRRGSLGKLAASKPQKQRSLFLRAKVKIPVVPHRHVAPAESLVLPRVLARGPHVWSNHARHASCPPDRLVVVRNWRRV
ncbi:hypothetical protein ACLOJK_027492 [Asimina triloba]